MAECEFCHNRRWVRDASKQPFYIEIPCPACNGQASQSCCEGQVGGPGEVTNTGTDDLPDDWDQRDGILGYNEGIRIAREKVLAGQPVPEMFTRRYRKGELE